MRLLRIAICAIIMAGVSTIDLGASWDQGTITDSAAQARRHKRKKHHRKHARKHKKHRKHHRSRSHEL
jgi:hypothetical protein